MKITFKDVGQGDSIILEWETKAVKKIGILDCNLKGRINPVLKHIADNKYAEIEFIILSHPHRDHYSGLLQLLTYCENKKIQIRNIAHTLLLAGKKYWKYFEVSSRDTKRLNLIIKKLKKLKEEKIILRIQGLMNGVPLLLANDMQFVCLAPSHDDVEAYQNIVKNEADKNAKEASQAANHLATIFLLSHQGVNILFTSDAETLALQKIIDNYPEKIKKIFFHVCQLPHHGSSKNHLEDFWKIVKPNKKHSNHAIASAGKHRTYNHPSFEVLKFFHDEGYIIHCTNILNGMKEYTRYLTKITESSLDFEGGSILAEEYRKSCDRVFTIQDNQIILI